MTNNNTFSTRTITTFGKKMLGLGGLGTKFDGLGSKLDDLGTKLQECAKTDSDSVSDSLDTNMGDAVPVFEIEVGTPVMKRNSSISSPSCRPSKKSKNHGSGQSTVTEDSEAVSSESSKIGGSESGFLVGENGHSFPVEEPDDNQISDVTELAHGVLNAVHYAGKNVKSCSENVHSFGKNALENKMALVAVIDPIVTPVLGVGGLTAAGAIGGFSIAALASSTADMESIREDIKLLASADDAKKILENHEELIQKCDGMCGVVDGIYGLVDGINRKLDVAAEERKQDREERKQITALLDVAAEERKQDREERKQDREERKKITALLQQMLNGSNVHNL